VVPDTQWIEDATQDGRLLVGADLRLRYRTLERQALCDHRARYVAFPRGDMTAIEMIDRVVVISMRSCVSPRNRDLTSATSPEIDWPLFASTAPAVTAPSSSPPPHRICRAPAGATTGSRPRLCQDLRGRRGALTPASAGRRARGRAGRNTSARPRKATAPPPTAP
jgi:hypothetical protein